MPSVTVPNGWQYGGLKPARIAVGPDSARAADAIRKAVQDRRDAWPYPHVYPPENSIRRDPTGTVVCPAQGVQDVILTFTVPQGNYFYMQALGLFFNSQTFNFGDFLFTVDKNVPLGVTTFQGVPLTDWQNIAFPWGSSAVGPVPLARAELFAPSDVIRAKVTNVNLNGGAPNWFGAIFAGYLVPTVDVRHAE